MSCNHDTMLCDCYRPATPWLQMRWVLAKRWLARVLQNASVKLGGPRAHWDGVPAALELDDIVNELAVLGVPESVPCPDGSPWPLCPRERMRLLRDEVLALRAGDA
jgi:hypothetical protein